MSATGYVTQWAVRMPNGDLYASRPVQQAQSGYGMFSFFEVPSPVRDMLGLTEPQPPKVPVPSIFQTREEAEKLLGELRDRASAMGVENWGGAVVQRLCTPFTVGDAGAQFVADVQAWIESHGGVQ